MAIGDSFFNDRAYSSAQQAYTLPDTVMPLLKSITANQLDPSNPNYIDSIQGRAQAIMQAAQQLSVEVANVPVEPDTQKYFRNLMINYNADIGQGNNLRKNFLQSTATAQDAVNRAAQDSSQPFSLWDLVTQKFNLTTIIMLAIAIFLVFIGLKNLAWNTVTQKAKGAIS